MGKLLALGLSVVSSALFSMQADAKDWTVTFQLTSEQVGDVEIGDELVIPESGGTGTGSAIPGFTMTYTPATASVAVRIDADFALNADCVADVLITGSATVTGSNSLLAIGNIQSNSTSRCVLQGQVFETALPISGTFRAVAPGDDTAVVDALITGTIRVTTAGNASFPLAAGSATLRPGTTIITGPGDRVVLTFTDGSVVEVEENSLFVIETDDLLAGLNLYLTKGFARIRASLQSSLGRRFSVRTPVAVTSVRGTEYSLQHRIDSFSATTTVTVVVGQVEVESRNGEFYQLSANDSQTITDTVNRPLLMLPVDEYLFSPGTTQWFSWLAYTGAAGYLLEAITDPPGFFDTNPAGLEPGTVRLLIPLSQVAQAEGIVEWGLNVPVGEVAPGTVVWWRVFATDANGAILPGVTASDAAVFTVN